MKKLLYSVSVFLLISSGATAQQLVFDPAVLSALVINHESQQTVLKDIKKSEGEISSLQMTISYKMAQIQELESKMYNSLKTVQSIVGQGKNVIYASTIAGDIGKYQSQMMDIAQGDPQLMLIAAKTELALINRTADLFTYIYQVAIIGTDMNLMNNADRLELIRHVVDELRVMRGLAYSISRKMRVAKYAGLWNAMNPLGRAYPNHSQAIIKSLLDEYKTIKK